MNDSQFSNTTDPFIDPNALPPDQVVPLPPLYDPSDKDEVEPAADPRHQRRIELMQELFARTFQSAAPISAPAANDSGEIIDNATPENDQNPITSTINQLITHIEELDALLQTAAPERPIKDINKIDLAILRLTMFESREEKTPKKVLINEAIELAKKFGTDSSPRFVNGVLGKLLMPDEKDLAV